MMVGLELNLSKRQTEVVGASNIETKHNPSTYI
jgi:hypothetical protein